MSSKDSKKKSDKSKSPKPDENKENTRTEVAKKDVQYLTQPGTSKQRSKTGGALLERANSDNSLIEKDEKELLKTLLESGVMKGVTPTASPDASCEISVAQDKSLLADDDVGDEEYDISAEFKMDEDASDDDDDTSFNDMLHKAQSKDKGRQEEIKAKSDLKVEDVTSSILSSDEALSVESAHKYRALAGEAFKLILLGRIDEARCICEHETSKHPLMAEGLASIDFLLGTLPSDLELTSKARVTVSRSQKMCKGTLQASRRLLRHKKGGDQFSAEKLGYIVHYYESRICIADLWALTAVLTAVKMNWVSFIKAGWQLRRAFRIYCKVHKELNKPRLAALRFPGEEGNRERRRLLASTAFGYGMFHLALSLVPSTQATLLKLLGMTGDRMNGLMALKFCMEVGLSPEGGEPRFPFAILVLVQYYAFMRPMLTISDQEKKACLVYSKCLIGQFKKIKVDGKTVPDVKTESKNTMADCVLYMIIKARILKSSKRSEEAIKQLELALKQFGHEPWMENMNLLLQFELAWANVACLEYEKAGDYFLKILDMSQVGKVGYGYQAALCIGVEMTSDTPEAVYKDLKKRFDDIMKIKVKKIFAKSGSQTEPFVQSRTQILLDCLKKWQSSKLKSEKKEKDFIHKEMEFVRSICQILMYECMYHWGALPKVMSKKHMKDIVLPHLTQFEADPDWENLALFLKGTVLRRLGQFDEAEKFLKKAFEHQDVELAKRFNYIRPYAALELATNYVVRKETEDPESNKNNVLMQSEEVAKYLGEIKKYKNGYDFENLINFFLHQISKRVDDLYFTDG